MAKKASQPKKEVKAEVQPIQQVSYSVVALLGNLVRGLKTSTYNDFERVKVLVEITNEVQNEFQVNVTKKEFESRGIEELTPESKHYSEVIAVLNKRYNEACSLSLERLKVFTKEEFIQVSEGVPLNYNDRELLQTFIVKE